MLPQNIPEDVPDVTTRILENRYPNYCETCGTELVLAGGWQRLVPGKGLWYDHIDVVLTCSSAECPEPKRMHMSGLDRDAGLGYYRDTPRSYDDEFAGISAYCEHHGDDHVRVTKDIEAADGRPLRQWKCAECDRGFAVVSTRE